MTQQHALETVIAAARAYAQSIADDADKSPEDQAHEDEIWEAIESLDMGVV